MRKSLENVCKQVDVIDFNAAAVARVIATQTELELGFGIQIIGRCCIRRSGCMLECNRCLLALRLS